MGAVAHVVLGQRIGVQQVAHEGVVAVDDVDGVEACLGVGQLAVVAAHAGIQHRHRDRPVAARHPVRLGQIDGRARCLVGSARQGLGARHRGGGDEAGTHALDFRDQPDRLDQPLGNALLPLQDQAEGAVQAAGHFVLGPGQPAGGGRAVFASRPEGHGAVAQNRVGRGQEALDPSVLSFQNVTPVRHLRR